MISMGVSNTNIVTAAHKSRQQKSYQGRLIIKTFILFKIQVYKLK